MANAATGLLLQELHVSNDMVIFRVPLVNALRSQFSKPSREVLDIILVAQVQMKDGFMAVKQK